MNFTFRPLAAGCTVLFLVISLNIFLNHAKFSSILEKREIGRHTTLGNHLVKALDAHLALGLALDDSGPIQALLSRERLSDFRLRAMAVLDTIGTVKAINGSGRPDLWQKTHQALIGNRQVPTDAECGVLMLPLHDGYGLAAGWLVLEYDLKDTHWQTDRAFSRMLPVVAMAMMGAMCVLALLNPIIIRRHAGKTADAHRQLIWLVAGLVAVVECIAGWGAYQALAEEGVEDASRLAGTLALTLKPGIELALNHGIPLVNLRDIEAWLQPTLETGPEYLRLAIDDTSANRLFNVARLAGQNVHGKDFSFPLQLRGEVVGSLVVGIDLELLAERTRQMVVDLVTLLVLGILISLEALRGLLVRSVTAEKREVMAYWRLPLFLFFVGSELPRAFLPMWARQLAQNPLPANLADSPIRPFLEPITSLPSNILVTLPISIFLFAVVLISPFAGRLSGRFGPDRLFRFGLVVSLCGHCLAVFSESLLSLSVARLLAGAGSGCVTVAALDCIGRRGGHAQGVALYLTANVAAGICGAGLGALLVERVGMASVFAMATLSTLLAGFALGSIGVRQSAGHKETLPGNAIMLLLREPTFIRMLILVGLPMQLLQQGLLFYWMPLALHALGEPASFIGLSMMGYFLFVLLLSDAAARWADRNGRHLLATLGGLAVAGVVAVCYSVAHSPVVIAIGAALIGAVWAAMFPTQGALVLRFKMQHGALANLPPATVVGVYRMLERIGAVLAAPVIAALIGTLEYSGTAALVGALLLGCALLQSWQLKRESVA